MINKVRRHQQESCNAKRSRNEANLINLVDGIGINSRMKAPLFRFSYLNAGSIKNKTTSLRDYIITNSVDVMVLTETWLFSDERKNAVYMNKLIPRGYYFKHAPRQDECDGYGGVGLLHRKSIKVVLQKKKNSVGFGATQFECLDCVVSMTNDTRSNVRLIIVYRPPPSDKNKLKLKSFWPEWKKALKQLAADHKPLIIAGDVNLHLDITDNSNTVKFKNILNDLDLVQLVNQPTHTAGHILDVIITTPENKFIVKDSLIVHDPGIVGTNGIATQQHHYAISFNLNFVKPKTVYKEISYRNIRNLDKQAFLCDLDNCDLEFQLREMDDVDEMVKLFVTTTVYVLDKHAPCLLKKLPDRPSNSWYTSDLTKLKQEKRRLERRWMKSSLEIHRLEYRRYCAVYANALESARIKKAQEDIAGCERNKTKLFKTCRSFLDLPKTKISLEGCNDDKEIAQAFSEFFKSKTENIRLDLDKKAELLSDDLLPSSKLNLLEKVRSVPKLSLFKSVTVDYMKKLIVSSNDKSCRLDLIPPRILKMFPSKFAPYITLIVNRSLTTGYVPLSFKAAIVMPSIKKYNLVPTVKESYRPVSNLQYISKLLEKTVFAQLEEHLSTFSLLPNSQSAYRKQHSTETSLLKVSNDILSQLNQGRSTLLVKLDISAAFDTVNHRMLLERYSDYFGLSDTVLDWFHSYVSNRTQSVQVGSELSEYVEINCGFAQGSTLGGPKYNMFTSPLHELIELHDISHEGYADDSNLYVSFDLKNNVETTDAVLQMENCLSDVTRWMLENRLKLNTTKTEAVLFHPPRTAISPDREIVINMEGHRIDIQQDIESLGVFLDKKMSMKKQVGLTTSKAFYHLRRISQVRKLLNRSITETLVNTLVTSRLDYCNSLLCSLPNSTMKKMQSVQNAAAKLILLKPKRDHVTPF